MYRANLNVLNWLCKWSGKNKIVTKNVLVTMIYMSIVVIKLSVNIVVIYFYLKQIILKDY